MIFTGWFTFHFLISKDATHIVTSPWVKGRGYLPLQRWKLCFDLAKDTPWCNIIWVKLPGFLLDLWTKVAISSISNKIGKIYFVEEDSLGGLD